MSSRSLFSSLMLVMILVLSSCSSRQEKLSQKISETPATNLAEVDKKFNTLIENSKTLSAEQKKKMLDLHSNTEQKVTKIQQEGQKLHAILVEEYGKGEPSKDLVKDVKKRMVKNSKKRLKAIFNALDEADKVLGSKSPEHREELMHSFYYENMGR